MLSVDVGNRSQSNVARSTHLVGFTVTVLILSQSEVKSHLVIGISSLSFIINLSD